MALSMAMPAPKKTLSTMARAASSLRWLILRISKTAPIPATPEIVAPIASQRKDLGEMPNVPASRKAKVMPGRVAWPSVSPSSERLRRRRKVPASPAAAPKRQAPARTTRVLWSWSKRTRQKDSIVRIPWAHRGGRDRPQPHPIKSTAPRRFCGGFQASKLRTPLLVPPLACSTE